jgi:hypothetical protein
VHPVFHVSQLKPFLPNYSPVFSELPKAPDLTAKEISHVAIPDRIMSKKGQEPVVQLQVQWSTLPVSDDTWEDYTVLRSHYPKALIWEEASSQEKGNVTSTTTV